MRRNFTYYFSWILIIALAVTINHAFARSPQTTKTDTVNYYLASKKPKKKSPLTLSFPPIKPGVISTTKVNLPQAGDKLLSKVEVFPNPATDQINIKYSISRNSIVSVKLMDILGNNVATLFSQSVEPGDHAFPPYIIDNSKISKGFYFVRVVAGNEFVIRRISIL